MEIMTGVHRIEGARGAQCYLVGTRIGWVVIDAGIGATDRALLSVLSSIGAGTGDVKFIALTHAHIDHSQGAPAVMALTGAPVAAHRLELPALEGRRPPTRANPRLPLAAVLNRLVRFSDHTLFHFRPVEVDIPLEDGDCLGGTGFVAVHVPGHTPGSVAYFDPDRRLLFAGDALTHMRGRLRGPVRFFSEDMVTARRSVARLAALEPEICLFGHGEPLLEGTATKLFDLATRDREDRPSA